MMIASRRHLSLLVPALFLGIGSIGAAACHNSDDDDNDACSGSTCAGDASVGDANILPTGDGSIVPTADGSTTDGAVTTGGPPITLADHLDTANCLYVNSGYVYMSESVNPGRVLRVPTGGGELETLAGGFQFANAVTTDGTTAYVAEGLTGNIYKFPVTGSDDGGVPQRFLYGSEGAGSLALNATHIYWGTGDYGHAIFSYAFGDDAAAPPNVFGGNMDLGITIDSTDMFWGNQYVNSISTRSLSPEAGPQFDLVPEVASAAFNRTTEVRPQNGIIYWGVSTASTGGIYSFPILPQSPPISPQLLVSDPNMPAHLDVDAKYVYWSSGGVNPSGLEYIPLTGGPIQILSTTTGQYIFAFTQDANYIYYTTGTNSEDATLTRVAKPN